MKSLLTIFLITFSLSIYSQKDKYGIDLSNGQPRGLNIGEEAPNFKAKDVNTSKEVSLKEILEQGPVVVMFYRGQWCPVCNRHLSNVADSMDLIRKKGAALVAIAPQSLENAQKTIDKTDLSAIVINDTSGKIMEDYQVKFEVSNNYQRKIKTMLFTDIAKNNSQDKATLPVPATYIINRNGKIIWRHFDLNYKNRASIKTILEHL